MDKLKPFVNDKKLYDSFLEMLSKEIELEQKGLEQAKEFGDMRNFQGAIRALRKLQKLRDKVNND
jgi:hypothetical protein